MRQHQRAQSRAQARTMTSGDTAAHLDTCGTRTAPCPVSLTHICRMDAPCESPVALTHWCSSYPSHPQESSSRPSLLSTGNPLVHWATTSRLLGDCEAAPPSGHRVCCCRSWPPSGGCYYMAWWLGLALWLSPWLMPVMGQAWVQWGLACEAVHDGRSGLRSASDFHSFGTRRPTNLQHGAHVWRPGRATGRQRESCGKPWRPRERSAGRGWSLLGRAKGPSAHASLSTAWIVKSARVRCVYTPCKSLQVKPRVGQPSLCTLYTQP